MDVEEKEHREGKAPMEEKSKEKEKKPKPQGHHTPSLDPDDGNGGDGSDDDDQEDENMNYRTRQVIETHVSLTYSCSDVNSYASVLKCLLKLFVPQT